MNTEMTPIEQNADRTGKIGAAIGLVLLLALLLIPVFFTVLPAPGQPGILVNLGFVDQGQGNENAGPAAPAPAPDPTPEPPTPAPDPTPPPPPPAADPDPAPAAPDVIQQEDPAEVALRRERERQEAARRAEQDRIRQAELAEQRRQQEQADAERRRREAAEARQRELDRQERERQERLAAEKARRDAEANATRDQIGGLFGSGSGNGNTGTPGNQGTSDGDPNADRLTGISTGAGRVSGGLGGRGVIRSPAVRDNSQREGRVVVEVCVNPDGKIISAKYTQNGSNTADPNLVSAAKRNAESWAFKPEPGAPARQCGNITYDFKVQ